jgi:curved DNA-binding protein CbpA
VSEAYHVLGSDAKRKKYDREHFHTRSHTSSPFPHGSHSSHTSRKAADTGPGGRPASGLSRRRTQFRGPPPSFYQSGGYGRHSAKRHAAGGDPEGTTASAANASGANTNPGGLGSKPPGGSFGYGPGQDSSPSSDEIPYWNKNAHFQTHDALRQRREQSGAARALGLDEASIGGSMALNFILVSTIIGLVAGISHWIQSNKEKRGSSGKPKDNG